MWRQQQRCTLCAMTETPPPSDGATGATSTAQPPPPPPPPPAPLYRPREGRVFRGVCAAIGRATGTDPVLWRVLVVVFLFFGGAGLVLYLAGWLFLPDEGEPPTELQRLFRGQGASTGGAIGLAVLVVIAALVVFDDGRGLLPLIVVAALAYLVLRDRQSAEGRAPVAPGPAAGAPPAGWAPPPAWPAAAGTPPGGWGAAAWGPPPPPPPPPPPVPPRPRSPLGLLTVSAAVLVVGALLLAGGLGADGITATRVLAAALLVIGLGLLAGTVWGRARWLIAPALVLAVAVATTASFDGRFGTATGERSWVVSGSADYELGAGSATLDLRPLAGRPTSGIRIEASVGAGELVVLVPEDLRVAIDSNVGLGEYVLIDGGSTQTAGGGACLERAVLLGPPGTAAVRVETTVGFGSLEVRRVAAR